jgi:hypothetical protein
LPSLVLDAGVVQTLMDLRDALVPAAPTARNLTIAGSATNLALLADLQRSAFSNLGADLFAVGDDVSTIDLLVKDGTSYSTPQVAGLASMLWLLDADLRVRPVEQTLALIRATSANNARLGGVIDAYAAVLAIDARRQRLDVRKALLDVNGDGVFDHLDLQAFMRAYAVEPTARDYSRHDLNGDGFTGGINTERFALEPGAVGATPTGNVTLTIEGYEINMNQAALSDLQILCYYAYATDASGSPLLYDSRTEAITERTSILGPERCVQARIVSTFGGAITAATPLTATVQVPSGGSFAPAPNVRVEASANCGSVAPAVSTTDGLGQVALTAAPASGCTSIDVTLVARASAGTAALATQTFSATVGGASSARGTQRDAIVEAEFGGSVIPDDPATSAPFNPLPLEGHWLVDGSLGAFSNFNLTQKDSGAYVVGSWAAGASVAETTQMSADGSNLTRMSFDALANCSLSRPSDYAVCDSNHSVTPCVQEGASARGANYKMSFDVVGKPMTARLTGEITVTRGPTTVQFPTVSLDRREAQVTLKLGAIALPSFIDRKGQTIDGAAGAPDIQPIDATVVLAPGSYSIDAKAQALCSAVDNATPHFARVKLSLSLTP